LSATIKQAVLRFAPHHYLHLLAVIKRISMADRLNRSERKSKAKVLLCAIKPFARYRELRYDYRANICRCITALN
jgi:hypothetical protein